MIWDDCRRCENRLNIKILSKSLLSLQSESEEEGDDEGRQTEIFSTSNWKTTRTTLLISILQTLSPTIAFYDNFQQHKTELALYENDLLLFN